MTQPAAHGSSSDDDRRIVLVTGATSGIGFHTAAQLAARGACVLITGRDQRRGEDAARAIASAAPQARAEFIKADHSAVGANGMLADTLAERLAGLGLAPGSTCSSITIQSTRDYLGIRAYARAKLLTAAWTIILSRQQAGLTTATVNPRR
jgi:short-subunit dehydrogenase